MGDSKRRKEFDPNYGKTPQMQPQVINYCNSALAQESAFITVGLWFNIEKTPITPIDITHLNKELLHAYNISRQKEIIDLGIHRQYEQSLGCLNLMQREFKEELSGIKRKEGVDLIFTWLPSTDIEKEYKLHQQKETTKTRILEIVNYLTKNCDPTHQFPVWFSGIPCSWHDHNMHMDLIFVCDQNNPEKEPINIINTSTNYL
jgi:hypothetical protein